MPLAQWALLLGLLLLGMVAIGTLLGRLPLTAAMVYLTLGALLSPLGTGVLHVHPIEMAATLERAAEAALLISLFAVGLQLGVPIASFRWRLPLKLAFVSLGAMVAMIALVGALFLNLSPGAAVLLGAILAPTDPVLASGVPSEPGERPDRLGFSLAAEGGLNDGAAYPFVLLGLGLMGLGEQRFELGRWLALDLAWATVGGGVIGGLLGAGVGRLIVHLRSRHGQAVGQDMFLGLGLIGVSYGVAHLCLASGFLSVFAAGLALRRVSEQPRTSAQSLHPAPHPAGHSYITLATHSHHASLTMRSSVEAFNGQIEKIAEMALVLLVGAMLPYALLPLSAWWFIPLLLIVLRPVSVLISTAGERLNGAQCALVSWFGIRGIGSVFYVLFAVRHGMGGEEGQMVVSLTLWTVAASIVAHGVSAKPLMLRYLRGKPIAAMEE